MKPTEPRPSAPDRRRDTDETPPREEPRTPSVLFVHGTGVRKESYGRSFGRVSEELGKVLTVSMVECYWGHLGSDLHAGGGSIPNYDKTRALAGEPGDADVDYTVELWGVLYEDPLYELRMLALRPAGAVERPPGREAPGEKLARLGRNFSVTDDLRSQLARGEIAHVFAAARDAVTASAAYEAALEAAPASLAEDRAAIARAIIAESIRRASETNASENNGAIPTAAVDRPLRDAIEASIVNALGGTERSIGGWVKQQSLGLVARLSSPYFVRRRGAITDSTTPAAGDILLYQARGDEIGGFIRDCIVATPRPRVVVAHSLGGIACVDLLMAEDLDVRLLVTIGSQAPFLYEIGALRSRKYGEPLPPHFPKWLNIYDHRDFLSYVGAKLFPGRVTDVRVDNKQPFPMSHSAYWANPEVWQAVAGALK